MVIQPTIKGATADIFFANAGLHGLEQSVGFAVKGPLFLASRVIL